MLEGIGQIRELIGDYEETVINGIIAWVVHQEFATEEQLAPLRDGSYKDDLPADTFRSKPKPDPTGLGDGSTWPLELRYRLPRFDEPYFDLFNVRVSKLDRLVKADNHPRNYETVAELRARKAKALQDEYPPSTDVLVEIEAAIGVALDRTIKLVESEGGDIVQDARVDFLLTLRNRVAVLLNNWGEDQIRKRLERVDQLFRGGFTDESDRRLMFHRTYLLYRIASLSHEGQWLRGYKSGLGKHTYYSHSGGLEALLAKAVKNSQGVLVQLPEPHDRHEYLAGLEQGVRDGQPPQTAD